LNSFEHGDGYAGGCHNHFMGGKASASLKLKKEDIFDLESCDPFPTCKTETQINKMLYSIYSLLTSFPFIVTVEAGSPIETAKQCRTT